MFKVYCEKLNMCLINFYREISVKPTTGLHCHPKLWVARLKYSLLIT